MTGANALRRVVDSSLSISAASWSRRGLHRTAAAGTLAALVLLACPGCLDTSCEPWDSPCPEWFDLNEYCFDSGQCRVGGQVVEALTTANFEKGEWLTIPVDDFADQLEQIQDLFVTFVASGPVEAGNDERIPPSSKNATVLLDGVPGAYAELSPGESGYRFSAFRWDPFPAAPQLLELSYADGNLEHITLSLWFGDFACEDANPPPLCEL